MFFRNLTSTRYGVRFLGAAAVITGSIWLLLWFSGIAARWSAEGLNTVKTNMALCQVLAGVGLVLLAPGEIGDLRRRIGMIVAVVVFATGALTLSEHLFGYNLGIDQLLASEPAGAVATASPNRMGPPGSSSLMLVGAGLFFLACERARIAAWVGVCLCVINLIPAVGFLYGITGFYSNPRLTGISWPTVVVLLSLGAGLVLARPAQGPAAQLLRKDAGGILLRRVAPGVILIPLVLGYLRVQGEARGWYDTATGTGAVIIIIVVGFLLILWRTARVLSQGAQAKGAVDAKLREGEERYRRLFNDDLTGDFISTPEGRILLCNPAFATMFEFASVEEAIGTSMLEFYVDPGERKPLMERLKREGKIERLGVWRKRRSGAPIYIVENIVGHFNELGELYEVNGYMFDDTERKIGEEALTTSEKRFATLVEQAPVGIFETDPQGHCIFVNGCWQALAGLSASEASGQGWMEAIDPKDRERVCAEWQAAAEGQREFSSEYRFRKPDGKVSWVMGRAKPIQDDSGAVVRYLGTLLDITERKRAEQLGVLEDVFRVAPSFLHVLRGPDFVFEFANEAYYRLVGQRDLIGRPAFEAMPEAAEGGYPERIARVMETGEAFFGRELSVTLMRTPGAEPEQRIIDLVYLPLKDAEGTCTGVLGHGTDVTEHVRDRKRAEEAMRQKAEELQGVLDTAPVAVWIAQDRECRVITGNAYADELVMGTARGGNISRSAAPGKAAVNYRVFQEGVELRPEDLPAQRAAATCRPVSAFEMELVFPDGRSLNLLAGAVPLFDGQGNVRGAIVAGLDVTSLKKAQEALRESERRFRLMADGTPLIIWVSDANGDNQYVNRAYREFFGLTAAEAEGQGWQPLVHPEDRAGYVEAISTATREHKTLRAQIRVRRHDGAWRWIESYAEPRFSASGEFLGMAGSCPDITEQKAFQTELERLVAERTARLQELVGELEHFSFTITHDLKSPLRAMRGFADLAGAMCAEGEQGQAREYLGRIARAAERMDRLIADALSYSKSVRQELTLEDVDAGALLRGMLDTYPELQPEKARIRVEGRLPVVQANESGLTQVFSNLLGNAVKFAKRGEIAEIRVWAEEGKSDGSGGESRSEKPGSGRVRIWVEDKGIGIAKEMLPRVFDMFARASKDYEGTGIGLALVRKVAQRMGGKVGVESEEGKGSRFFIELKRGEGQAWPG